MQITSDGGNNAASFAFSPPKFHAQAWHRVSAGTAGAKGSLALLLVPQPYVGSLGGSYGAGHNVQIVCGPFISRREQATRHCYFEFATLARLELSIHLRGWLLFCSAWPLLLANL
jgi:hypothetical protein